MLHALEPSIKPVEHPNQQIPAVAAKPSGIRPEPEGDVEYRIDGDDNIYLVNLHWKQFARLNGTPELAESIIGKSIWSYISGLEIRHIYESLFNRTRRFSAPVNFVYRCDAPDKRRWLNMSLTRLQGGGIRLQSRIVRTEPRPHLRLVDPEAVREESWIVVMCSWCQRFKFDELNDWRHAEHAIDALGLFARETMPAISHGICPSCCNRFH